MRSHVVERNQNYYASESEVKVTEKNDEKSEESSAPVKKKVDPNNPLLTKTGILLFCMHFMLLTLRLSQWREMFESLYVMKHGK